jgi:ABC-type phosphate transport system substrate-binding protein
MAPVPSHVASMLAIALALPCMSSSVAAQVVAVVSIKCPLTGLTKSQAADIFLGKAARFPDGSTAVPIDQAEGSPSRDEFYLAFAGKSAAQLNAHWSKLIFTGRGQPPAEVANAAEVKKRLAANPNAIGYIETESVDSQVKVVATP